MNPFIVEMTVKERRREMLEESERLRLVALYNANNTEPKGRIAIALGNFLIRTGQKLKLRYEQEIETTGQLCKD